jgi:tellurite resistance protein TerC
VTVPAAWAAFVAFVLAMLALDLFVLHRRAHEVSLKVAVAWTAVWVAIGLGFAALLWAWRGGGTAQAYLAGYLIEKSLSLDNVFVFAVIFSAFAIPARYQHRVLMLGIAGALFMRAAFVVAGVTLLEAFHPVIYLFGAVLLAAAVPMLRGGHHPRPAHNRPSARPAIPPPRPRASAGHPAALALIVIETTDVVFAVDSIPAILAVTTDPFVVYTSNVFALLGMRALYFLLTGAAIRFRYLQPGLAVILVGVAAKLLLADVYKFPAWASPAFIAVVLAVAMLSIRDHRRANQQPAQGNQDRTDCRSQWSPRRGNADPVPSQPEHQGPRARRALGSSINGADTKDDLRLARWPYRVRAADSGREVLAVNEHRHMTEVCIVTCSTC